MELDINGTIVASPRAEDIARALDAPSFAADWYIALDDGAGGSLDAVAEAGGGFTLTYGSGKQRRHETADAARVKEVYLKFLAGERTGQGPDAPHTKFVPDTRPLQGKSGDNPPTWAIAVVVGVIGLVGLIFGAEQMSRGAIRDHVPFGDSDLFWIGLIFLPMLALVLVAIASKTLELRRAKGWAQTTGRILSAKVEVRRHQFAGEPETVKNVPAVQYEFHVGARKVIGSRIGIGDDAAANPEATLKRYPAGANVTVYYDPRDPTQCVLDALPFTL